MAPSPLKTPLKSVIAHTLTTADTVHGGGMGRAERGANEGGGEVLSHLISLDTRHPASFKQPLSRCQSHGAVEDTAHAYYRAHLACTHTNTKQRPKDKYLSHLAP